MTEPTPKKKNTKDIRPTACSYGGFRHRLDYDALEKKHEGINLPDRRRILVGVLVSLVAVVMAIALGVIIASMESMKVSTKKNARRPEMLKNEKPPVWWDNAA